MKTLRAPLRLTMNYSSFILNVSYLEVILNFILKSNLNIMKITLHFAAVEV